MIRFYFKKWLISSFLVIMSIVLLVGCGLTPTKQQKAETSHVANHGKQVVKADKETFPITVIDGTGKKVVIEKKPKTIVSLQPSFTEIVFALGAGNEVIGVSDYDNYPKQVQNIEKVGAQDMNVEKIMSLHPDLVLATPFHLKNHADILDKLKKTGINVIVINDATSFQDVYDSILLVAKTTGTDRKAIEIISGMKKRLAEVKEKAKSVKHPKRVWVEVSPSPDIYTTGKGTFMDEMLKSINAINVAGDQNGWVKYTEEAAVGLKPDIIITTYGFYVKNPTEGVLNRKGWNLVPAVKNKQVFNVDNDTVTRPGPRLIDGIEALGKFIYPEVFAK